MEGASAVVCAEERSVVGEEDLDDVEAPWNSLEPCLAAVSSGGEDESPLFAGIDGLGGDDAGMPSPCLHLDEAEGAVVITGDDVEFEMAVPVVAAEDLQILGLKQAAGDVLAVPPMPEMAPAEPGDASCEASGEMSEGLEHGCQRVDRSLKTAEKSMTPTWRCW